MTSSDYRASQLPSRGPGFDLGSRCNRFARESEGVTPGLADQPKCRERSLMVSKSIAMTESTHFSMQALPLLALKLA